MASDAEVVSVGGGNVERLFHKNIPPNSSKHTFTQFKANPLDEANPAVRIAPGELGLSRLVHATVYPINTYFDAHWDGNRTDPTFRFDTYPEDGFEFVVEAWGF